MASSAPSCIACGGSKAEEAKLCTTCISALVEIAAPEKEEQRPRPCCTKRKRPDTAAEDEDAPPSCCAACDEILNTDSETTLYCSVCQCAMTQITSPEEVADSVPPRQRQEVSSLPHQECAADSTLRLPRRLDFDAETEPGSDHEEAIDLMSPLGADERNDVPMLTTVTATNSLAASQSQESSPGSFCQVSTVLTAEDVVSRRFHEAHQAGNVLSLLSQDSD